VTVVLPGPAEASLGRTPFLVLTRERGVEVGPSLPLSLRNRGSGAGRRDPVMHCLLRARCVRMRVVQMCVCADPCGCARVCLVLQQVEDEGGGGGTAGGRLSQQDEELLFQQLCNLRNVVLSEMKSSNTGGPVAAHHVYTDATLRRMVAALPSTLEEISRIEGVGGWRPSPASPPPPPTPALERSCPPVVTCCPARNVCFFWL
jgi:hypothetical protein